MFLTNNLVEVLRPQPRRKRRLTSEPVFCCCSKQIL
jgi:hypothetical protein